MGMIRCSSSNLVAPKGRVGGPFLSADRFVSRIRAYQRSWEELHTGANDRFAADSYYPSPVEPLGGESRMGPMANVAAAQDIGRAFATGSSQARRRARIMALVLLSPLMVVALILVVGAVSAVP